MKNPKTLSIVVGLIVLLVFGFLFVRGPKPIIEIKAETLADIGPLPLVNTYVSSLSAVIVIITIAVLATRKLSIIPGKLQNLVEAVAEAGYNLCVTTAGEKNGRRFFAVFMTIFTFIWIANWMALLPFFNSFGAFEKVTAEEFHKEAVVMSKSADISWIKPNEKALEFDVDTSTCKIYDDQISAASRSGQPTKEIEDNKESCIRGRRGLVIADKLDKKQGTHSGVEACTAMAAGPQQDQCYVAASDKAIEQLNTQGERLGILKPYFRSMNTDLNSPLSIAIVAMSFVEFWGITALGFFRYGSKFLNFSSPLHFFVGLLEIVAETARVVSFTFRLFGNLLAGEIVLLVMTFLLPFIVALPFYGLEMFVGVIQAFIFAMLTLVFGVLAVSAHDDHSEHEPAEAAVAVH